MPRLAPGARRREVLEALATMLETGAGEPVTTAALAGRLEASEAALYRHFPSKAKMFEALIEFIEESLFPRMTRMLAEESIGERRVANLVLLPLAFADKNPGLACLMQGNVLSGETGRLRDRVLQLFGRIEAQLKQVLREEEWHQRLQHSSGISARLLMGVIEGRICRFVRSRFRESAIFEWDAEWTVLRAALFRIDVDRK
ncbi:MAG: nucleoid occlusion factor SlmA [Acidiferrobacteraceae bacterium]